MGHLLVTAGSVLVVALAVVLVAMPTEARISDETVLRLSPESAQRRLFGPLGSLRAARLEVPPSGPWVLHSSYLPSWAFLVAVVLFPVGLLVLLFARRRLSLQVRFLEEPGGGTRLQVAGRARRGVAWDLGEAVERLRATTAPAGAARTRR